MGKDGKMAKGISPLIAAVLLIAFTMAIAGIMATWATTFSRERLNIATEESHCVGATDLSSLSFGNGVISIRIRNVAEVNLSSLKAVVEYQDATKNKQYTLKDYNVTDPLPPGGTTFFIVNTTDATKPLKIEITAGNCPRQPATLTFR